MGMWEELQHSNMLDLLDIEPYPRTAELALSGEADT
jgi:hypothetical protein